MVIPDTISKQVRIHLRLMAALGLGVGLKTENREPKTGAEKTGTEAEKTEHRSFGCSFGWKTAETETISVNSVC